MVLQFELESVKSLEQVARFLAGSAEAEVAFPDRKALYEHIEQTLRRFSYEARSKPERGLLRRYRYQNMHTPYEKFKSLPGAAELLRPGLSLEQLDAQAYAHSDNEAVAQLYAALEALWLELPYEQTAVA